MRVIHDESGGFAAVFLSIDWGIKQVCQVRGCTEQTNSIVIFDASESPTGEALHLGICENHHKESSESGRFHYTIDR